MKQAINFHDLITKILVHYTNPKEQFLYKNCRNYKLTLSCPPPREEEIFSLSFQRKTDNIPIKAVAEFASV